jgi:hypothetical protein
MLPPGALRYLKGHPDGIVAGLLGVAALSALAGGALPWAVIGVLAVVLILYHLRCLARERHEMTIAELNVERAAAEVELIKARHRDLAMHEQPSLPLAARGRPLAGNARQGGT